MSSQWVHPSSAGGVGGGGEAAPAVAESQLPCYRVSEGEAGSGIRNSGTRSSAEVVQATVKTRVPAARESLRMATCSGAKCPPQAHTMLVDSEGK